MPGDQQLNLHPHVHCLVSGGGISEDGTTWHPARRTFLAASPTALDPTGLARTFKQGRKCEPKVVSVLSALVRMGYVITTNAGQSYLLRRAA